MNSATSWLQNIQDSRGDFFSRFWPAIVRFQKGATDYRVSAIPLGGYVKLGGDESNAPSRRRRCDQHPPEEMFNLRPRWQRILVALAGP